MKVTRNNLDKVKELGSKTCEDIIKLLESNEEFYTEGSEYGTDKGYGFQIYVVKDIQELKLVINENKIDLNMFEFIDIIEEDNLIVIKINYLVSCDNFVVFYIKLINNSTELEAVND